MAVVALAPMPEPTPLFDDDADDSAALDAYSVAVRRRPSA